MCFIFGYVDLCKSTSMHICRPRQPSGAGPKGSADSPNRGAGNQTQALCKSRMDA